MDRGKPEGWQGCGRPTPSGTPLGTTRCPSLPPVAVPPGTVGVLFHAEVHAGLPAALRSFPRCGESSRGRRSRRSAPAQGARLWMGPRPPSVSSKLNLLIAFPLPAPGAGMNGTAVNMSRAGARSCGADADASPSPGAARGPRPARRAPAPLPAGSPRPRAAAAAAQVALRSARRGGPSPLRGRGQPCCPCSRPSADQGERFSLAVRAGQKK